MSKTMFELVRTAKSIDLMLEAREGEIDETQEIEIYKQHLALQNKVDACSAYHEHLGSELAKWENKVKEVTACKKRAEGKLKRFEEYLILNLRSLDGKAKGNYNELSIKETSGNLIITDKEKLPSNYKKEVVTTEIVIDNKSIKEDLKLGIPIDGAEIKTNYSLKIKAI